MSEHNSGPSQHQENKELMEASFTPEQWKSITGAWNPAKKQAARTALSMPFEKRIQQGDYISENRDKTGNPEFFARIANIYSLPNPILKRVVQSFSDPQATQV